MIEAFSRANDHADRLFVGDERTSSLTVWEDGDFQIEIFAGFDTHRACVHHGEQVVYQLTEEEFRYANFTREFGWHTDRVLKEFVIEEWSP